MSNIEMFEGERATNYDDFVETWIPCYNKFISLLPDLLLAQDKSEQENLAQNKKILIAGCGTGNEIEVLAKVSSNWHLTGVDPSPEMVSQARQKLSSYPNVNIFEGVVADLDSQQDNGKQYDAATLLLVLHFLEDKGDKLDLLKDIGIRLKAQAPLIVFDINGDYNHIKQNLSVLESLLPKNIDKEIVKFRLNRMQNSLHHVTEQRFIELCIEAGFETPTRFFQSTIYMGWMLKKA